MPKLLFLPLLAALIACGPPEPEPEPEPEFADTPLAGVIGGAEWTVQAAATDDFLSDEDGFFTTFFGEAVEDPCAAFGEAPKVLTQLPTAPGDYRMSFRRNLTFVVEEEELTDTACVEDIDCGFNSSCNADGLCVNTLLNNIITTSGDFRIESIDEDAGLITGAINTSLSGDPDNFSVDGTFEATICPPR